MKRVLLAAVMSAAALTTAPAMAAGMSVKELADLTGMKPREVQLMVGAYSTNTLYLTSFIRIKREWNAAMQTHHLLVDHVDDGGGKLVMRVRQRGRDAS